MPMISKNPATGEVFGTFPELSDAELEAKITLAHTAFQSWKRTTFAERADLMKKAGQILRENARAYGEIISKEMGKPIKAAITEVEKCGLACDFYADNAEKILAEEVIKTDNTESFVRFDPIGIVLAVMPWNFPLWQVVRFAAPALMAGNVGILKHASNVPQCGMLLEEVFVKAGFPAGCFLNLMIGASKVEKVIQDPRVMAATLTGSEWAGSQVAMQAGKEIKKTVLELGGSDPFIVLEDADLELTATAAVMARMQNCGQSCIAAKRFIVVESVLPKFLELYKANVEKLTVGDPMSEETQVGPLATDKIRDEIEMLVSKSVEKGAKILTGGKRIGDKGNFYAPTILIDVKPGMPAYSEEFFGPVALVISAKDEKDAIRIANDSPFGLGSSIWTKDTEKAKRLAKEIDAGSVFINKAVASDPKLPFGGIKKSGYGRELSHYGIKEFVNIKTVVVK